MAHYACPSCYKPIGTVKRNQDARCKDCRRELARERRAREKEAA